MFYILMIFLVVAIVVLSMGLFYSLNEGEDRFLPILFIIAIILSFISVGLNCFEESKQRTLNKVANGVKYEKVNGTWKEISTEQVKTINQ